MIWVDFPFGGGDQSKRGGPEKKALQNAIQGLQGHYMRLNLRVFQRLGHAV